MTLRQAAPGQVMLRADSLSWHIGGFRIVEGVTLDIHAGEFLSIIGPNGAGKTSLINLLSGVQLPSSGSIELLGRDVTRTRAADRSRLGMGRTFQTSSLFPQLSVLENARLAAQARIGGNLNPLRGPRATDAATQKARTLLSEVGLGSKVDQLVSYLAHGDKRKLEIAVVLCGEPEVVLLDEPTAGMSAEDVGPLVEVVRGVHARGCTVVMVEHHMELVLGISDRVAVMQDGGLLICDSPDVVMSDQRVREAYLGAAL